MAVDQVVTVGFDGSPEAQRAARWAAFDAQTRRARLRIVCAYSLADVAQPVLMTVPTGQIKPLDVRGAAIQLVDEIVRELAEDLPGADVEGRTVGGSRVRVLLDAAESSSIVVLGSRGLGPLAGAFLRSVGASVSARASCPVVVVRPPVDETMPPEPRLVVGVDGSDLTPAALRFAFDHAARHGLSLRAVMCSDPHLNPGPSQRLEASLAAERARSEGHLAEALAGWQLRYPTVRIERKIVEGNPVVALAEESHTAQLLVVGAHSRRGRTGALLGSISQGVLCHANAATVIVHSPDLKAHLRRRGA